MRLSACLLNTKIVAPVLASFLTMEWPLDFQRSLGTGSEIEPFQQSQSFMATNDKEQLLRGQASALMHPFNSPRRDFIKGFE